MVGKTHFINSKTSSGSAFRVRVIDDVSRRPMAPDLGRMSMPKQLQTQIHWFTSDASSNLALSPTGITEFNQSFSLGQTGVATPLSTLFDQYAIFAVYVRVAVTGLLPVGSSFNYYTAIDYDNTNNLSSVTALQAYGTVASSGFNEVQERYLEPCNAPALYSGSAFSHFGQARAWIDSSNTATPHYGLRIIANSLGTGGQGQLTVNVSYVICARNSI